MIQIPSSLSEEVDFWDYSEEAPGEKVCFPQANALHFTIDDGDCLSEEDHEVISCKSTACDQISDAETSPTACSVSFHEGSNIDPLVVDSHLISRLLDVNSILLVVSLCGALLTSV